ncbi:hypothetical protein C8R47DRAFT_1063773 [Mycena vitilis]|nr:hypothetical protein C8R47DRAFT_1063773 [Mycena vitilis]
MSPSGFPGTIKPTRRAIPTPPLEHEPPPAPAHLSQQASFGRCFWFSNLKSRDSSIGRSPESSQPLSLSQGKFITSRILEVTANLLLSRLDNALTLAGQSALQSGDSQTHHHDALIYLWSVVGFGRDGHGGALAATILVAMAIQILLCKTAIPSFGRTQLGNVHFQSRKPAASLLTWMSTPVLTFNLLTASQLNIVKVQYLDYPLHVLTGPYAYKLALPTTSFWLTFAWNAEVIAKVPQLDWDWDDQGLTDGFNSARRGLERRICPQIGRLYPCSSTLAFTHSGLSFATSGYTQRRWAHSIIVLRSKLQVCVDTRLFNAVVLALNFNARQQFHGQPQPQHRPNFNSTLLASPHFCLVPTFKPAPVFIRLSSSNSSGLGLGLHDTLSKFKISMPGRSFLSQIQTRFRGPANQYTKYVEVPRVHSQRRRDGTRECAGTRRAGVLGSARRTCTAVGGRVLSARQRRLACSEQRAQRAQSIRRGQPSGEVPALSAARARGRARLGSASRLALDAALHRVSTQSHRACEAALHSVVGVDAGGCRCGGPAKCRSACARNKDGERGMGMEIKAGSTYLLETPGAASPILERADLRADLTQRHCCGRGISADTGHGAGTCVAWGVYNEARHPVLTQSRHQSKKENEGERDADATWIGLGSFAGPGAVKGQEEEVAVLQVSGSSLPRSVIFRVTRPFIHVPQQHPRPQKKSNWSGGISVGSEPSPGSNKCTEKNNNPGVLVTRAKIAPTMNAEVARKVGAPEHKPRLAADSQRLTSNYSSEQVASTEAPIPRGVLNSYVLFPAETPDSLEPAFWGPVLLL